MAFTFAPTPLEGLLLIQPTAISDERGFFFESWREDAFVSAGLAAPFVQENHSRSSAGVLRGLHYQDMRAPMAKLVRCTAGSLFDVAVDLRVGSPTFGQWFGVELSAANKRQVFIPVGFAHGLQALEDGTEVQYKQTAYYAPSCEQVLKWDDPDVGIAWPAAPTAISARDRSGRSLADYLVDPVFT